MQLKIADITIDEMLTPRLSVDDELVREYRQALYSKCEFPPITVVKDEKGKMVLLDGRHRLEAHKLADRSEIAATLTNIKKDRWFYYAVKINAAHGRRLSDVERAKAVFRLRGMGFSDPEIEKAIATAIQAIKQRTPKTVVAKDDKPKTDPKESRRRGGLATAGSGNGEYFKDRIDRIVRALKTGEIPASMESIVEDLSNESYFWLQRTNPKSWGDYEPHE